MPLTGKDLTALSNLHEFQVLVTQHAGPAHERDGGALWSLIRFRTEDRPAWDRISEFNTSRDGQREIISLINNYKVDSHKNKEFTIAYTMLNKSTYDRECMHQTFEMFANKEIAQYKILMYNKEEIPQHKQSRNF